MTKPISVQLYSLREEAKKDFVQVLKNVAAFGYRGVEPAGLWGIKPAEARRIIEDLGMVVSSNHGPWPNPDNLNAVIDTAKELGTDLVVCGYGPQEFSSVESIVRCADTINRMIAVVERAGLTLCLHNHDWEFNAVGGTLGYDRIMDCCPKLKCEIDTYWAANFGACDPADAVRRYRHRAPLLHIKDGPLEKGRAHVACGKGRQDLPAIIAAADPAVLRWLVVELDQCDSDMTTAIGESYQHLVGTGLASGTRAVAAGTR